MPQDSARFVAEPAKDSGYGRTQFERDRAEAALHRAAGLESELAAMRGRRAVRYADKAQAMARRLRRH